MTKEQFEALKAWIRAMRDVDHAFAATTSMPDKASWISFCESAKALAIAEELARAELVEDKP